MAVTARGKGWVERPDCRIYYETMGSGPALVFAHGLGGNHLSWWQQVPFFSRRYTCVTYSHRGFAPSSAPAEGPRVEEFGADFAALIEHLELDEVVVIGQSMGGWSALDYAFTKPARLKALVLSATSGAIDPASLDGEGADRLAAWRAMSEAALGEGQARGEHPAGGARMAAEQPALHYLYRAMDELSALDKVLMRQRLFASRTRPVSDLASVAVPTLWVTGEEDIVFPSPVAPFLARAMPRGKHVEIPRVGHSGYFEDAAAFNAVVDGFLRRLG